MKKIKVFDESIVDLRGENNEDSDFNVKKIDEDKKDFGKKSDIKAVDLDQFSLDSIKSSNMVRVRFDKFLTLLSRYDYETALSNFMMQEIIITTDLLADLANPPEPEEVPEEPKKFPFWILFGGVIVGVFITWLILK